MKALRSFYKDRAAVAALEFALIMPLLLAVLAGIFEYGRVLLAEHAMRDIMDEAVRQGVVTNMSSAAVETQVDDLIATVPGIGDYDVDATDGAYLVITVTGSFDLVMGELLPDNVIDFTLMTQFPR